MPYYFTYLQEVALAIFGSENVPFGQSWSLGYEEKFYLLWPLIIFGFLKARKAWRPYVAGGLIVFFAGCGMAAAPGTAVGLLSPYYQILIGCLLALLKPRPGQLPLTYPVLVLLLLSQFVVPRFALPGWAGQLNDMAFTIAIAAFFAGILTNKPGCGRRWPGVRWCSSARSRTEST